MRDLLNNIKEKLYKVWYGRKGNKEWQRIMRGLGNPGVAWYVKKEYYHEALKFLDDNGQFQDLKRTGGVLREFLYENFEYRSEIIICDFSKEQLEDNDIIVMIWAVDKALKKN